MCSDGLAGQFEDSEICKVLSVLPLAEATQSLVDLANLRGGHDNITVITVKYLGIQKAEGKFATANPLEPATKTELEVPPLPAWFWNASVGALMLLLLAFPLAYYIAALGVPALLLMLGATGALAAYYFNRRPEEPFPNKRYGKGPYRQFSAECDKPFAMELRRMFRELRDSVKENPEVEWDVVNNFRNRAKLAVQNENWSLACQNYVRAISAIWRRLAGD